MQTNDAARAEQTIRNSAWGIDLNYQDASGEWHETAPETIKAIMRAMEADAGAIGPEPEAPIIVVRSGEHRELPGSGVIAFEDGTTTSVSRSLPTDLPIGYHNLVLDGGTQRCRLIVGPAQCWLPEDLHTWGWAVQLYAARSKESWGIGDFGDLEKLAVWSAGQGAGMMLVNPLSAAIPVNPQQASPYYPSSRRFFNPLWLNIGWIAGATVENVPQLEEIGAEARRLNAARKIDRDKVFALKMQALRLLWLSFRGEAEFDAFCAERGGNLQTYAVYCRLAEVHGGDWHQWPRDLRHPSNQAVARFREDDPTGVRFHQWVQWLLDQQFKRCAKHLDLVQDLPIGVDPNGADAWAWQGVLANGASVGAPPDEFNTQGQNWGLPPLIPHKLRSAEYEPFIQTVRAALRHAGGLRIDHVMGLFRLFWIPQGMEGSKGAYVRYNYEEMLTIVALESVRAHAYVVGEDLGTVEEIARTQLAARHILSYRLLWFEKNYPSSFPEEALAAVTTHDLPTVAGLWSGSDLRKQEELGLKPNEESTAEIHTRLQKMAGVCQQDSDEDVIAKAYELLATAPSRILTAALDDAAGVRERPNIPATLEDVNPNWSLALPMTIEELMQAELPGRIARALSRSSMRAR